MSFYLIFFRDLLLWKQILEFMLTRLQNYIVRYCGYSQGMPPNTFWNAVFFNFHQTKPLVFSPIPLPFVFWNFLWTLEVVFPGRFLWNILNLSDTIFKMVYGTVNSAVKLFNHLYHRNNIAQSYFLFISKYLIVNICDVSRVEYQLPNLIVGAITKESLYGAFENGITAQQVSIRNFIMVLIFLC